MTLRSLSLALLVALGATACNDTQSTEPVAPAEETGVSTSEIVTRLYATVGNNELSFETLGTFETRNGERVLVITATSNRYLDRVFSFVPDDAFGEANVISERRFEVVLREGHELNTVLSGLPLFISVDTFTGSPQRYYARIVVAPRFFDFRGSTSIAISENVNPVYVRNGTDVLVYRGRADVAASSLTTVAPDGTPVVSRVDADTFNLDWQYPAVYQAIDPHTMPITFTATLANNTQLHKTARLTARVSEFAVTAGDPYDVWPSPPCQAPVYNCIHSQPTGTTDFAACGTYREVSRCMYARACEVAPIPPLSLTSIDTASLEPARAAYNGGSSSTSWNSLASIDGYSTSVCPWATSIQAVMAYFNETTQDLPLADNGTFANRAGLSNSPFFLGAPNSSLLAALDAYAGGGELQAWFVTEEVPCHNCHNSKDYAVLYYPASGKVLVLLGSHGYDW